MLCSIPEHTDPDKRLGQEKVVADIIKEVLRKKPKLTMVDHGGYNCLMLAVKYQN